MICFCYRCVCEQTSLAGPVRLAFTVNLRKALDGDSVEYFWHYLDLSGDGHIIPVTMLGNLRWMNGDNLTQQRTINME